MYSQVVKCIFPLQNKTFLITITPWVTSSSEEKHYFLHAVARLENDKTEIKPL